LVNFPIGVVFYPYAFFRNIAGASRTVHMGICYDDGGHPKSLPLPDLTLAPGQVATLPIHDVLTGLEADPQSSPRQDAHQQAEAHQS
jgi:hypothetical protein